MILLFHPAIFTMLVVALLVTLVGPFWRLPVTLGALMVPAWNNGDIRPCTMPHTIHCIIHCIVQCIQCIHCTLSFKADGDMRGRTMCIAL